MARTARSDVFDPHQVSVFHCINRCVRRGFLCGVDPRTGNSYEHRKDWIVQRLAFLAEHYAIDVLGVCVLDNHFHVILRNRPDIISQIEGYSTDNVGSGGSSFTRSARFLARL